MILKYNLKSPIHRKICPNNFRSYITMDKISLILIEKILFKSILKIHRITVVRGTENRRMYHAIEAHRVDSFASEGKLLL